MKFFVLPLLLAALCLTLTNCGGGGLGGDDSPYTRRPKTMDGIVLTIGVGGRFEFVRGTGSSPALRSGDVETGTFFYTRLAESVDMDKTNGIGMTRVAFPMIVYQASYAYRAINDNQAVLSLAGVGAGYPTNPPQTGGSGIIWDRHALFNYGENLRNVDIDLSFAVTGSFVTTDIATMRQDEGAFSTFSVRADTRINLVTGGGVSENYNPYIDPMRPSRLSLESLHNRLIEFTNTGINNPVTRPDYNFTIQFVADAIGLPTNPPTEVGTGLLRIADSPIDNAVDYAWKRIPGTDAGELVITGSGTTFDGVHLLTFTSMNNGNYAGELDEDTEDVDEVTGTFTVTSN